jgi:histidinol dehydrogenase
MLKLRDKSNLSESRRQAFDETTLKTTREILADITINGDAAIRGYATKFGELSSEEHFVVDKKVLKNAYDKLNVLDQKVLKRTADRISTFAKAQHACLKPLKMEIDGGYAGHDFLPIDVAGCYAPGGRFPLPSSVLMTAIPAKISGVKTVIVSSPNPTLHTLAAAYVAGVDIFLKLGGVQAIAAMAYGTGQTPAAHVVVGPGNRWVTAAKQIVSSTVGIDMLAGPSELVVLADKKAEARIIAADLLAQAEHDEDALPVLVTTSSTLIDAVNAELTLQLETLPTRGTADASLSNGYAVLADGMDDAIAICNALAPEHLQILTEDAGTHAKKLHHCGGLFIGTASAEVIGDYGAGPNHTLPTGGTAKYKAGLSVLNFLRARTWIEIVDTTAAQSLYADAAVLARMEGLEAHARAANIRKEDRT